MTTKLILTLNKTENNRWQTIPTHSLPAKSTSCSFVLTIELTADDLKMRSLDDVLDWGDGDLERLPADCKIPRDWRLVVVAAGDLMQRYRPQ